MHSSSVRIAYALNIKSRTKLWWLNEAIRANDINWFRNKSKDNGIEQPALSTWSLHILQSYACWTLIIQLEHLIWNESWYLYYQ